MKKYEWRILERLTVICLWELEIKVNSIEEQLTMGALPLN